MIQVINRALDILEYVADYPKKSKQLSHIANDLNLNSATCANIVKTLVNRGYLKKSEGGKGYLLGSRIEDIANNRTQYASIIEAANVEMERATELLKENSLLAILKDDQRAIIHQKIYKQLIEANTPDQKKAYDSSTGRLMIAMLPENEFKDYIKKNGLPSPGIWPGVNNLDQLTKQLTIIRENGYALIEDSVQIVGIAAPVYQKEKVVAAFSIYQPAFRFNESMRKKLITTALNTAKNISNKLK